MMNLKLPIANFQLPTDQDTAATLGVFQLAICNRQLAMTWVPSWPKDFHLG
jgi:hypothetical protein